MGDLFDVHDGYVIYCILVEMFVWSRKHSCCIKCRGTEKKHNAKGLCIICYDKFHKSLPEVKVHRAAKLRERRRRNPDKLRQQLRDYSDRRFFGGNRQRVLERDKHRCTECGTKKQLIIHHKDGRGGHDGLPANTALSNLVTLCRRCHIAVHREDLLAAQLAALNKKT